MTYPPLFVLDKIFFEVRTIHLIYYHISVTNRRLKDALSVENDEHSKILDDEASYARTMYILLHHSTPVEKEK